METLAEALPKEQKRVRELLKIYQSIPNGILAASLMEQSLTKAEYAAISGDVIEMLKAYKDLKEYKS